MIRSQTYCPCFSDYENAVEFYVSPPPETHTGVFFTGVYRVLQGAGRGVFTSMGLRGKCATVYA